jgi:hypothetical protein
MVDYVTLLPALSNPFGSEDTSYFHGWTTFYWAWWIAWSPFVGMFIARISRGRTVREFVLCALIAPTAVCALWMSTFGGAAIDMLNAGGAEGVRATVIDSYAPEGALFGFLKGAAALQHRGTDLACSHRDLLCHLVGLRFPCDRHDHSRRQAGCTCCSARLVVHTRRSGGHRPAFGRWTERTSGGCGLNGNPVHDGSPDHVLLPMAGAAVRVPQALDPGLNAPGLCGGVHHPIKDRP